MDTVNQAVMDGALATAVDVVNEATMWATATEVFVALFMVALVVIATMAMRFKTKNVLMDKVVLRMDELAGNSTHNPSARYGYFGDSLVKNKWIAKRYLPKQK